MRNRRWHCATEQHHIRNDTADVPVATALRSCLHAHGSCASPANGSAPWAFSFKVQCTIPPRWDLGDSVAHSPAEYVGFRAKP
eukprot:350179-Chlamydomonas_euryale.AAC.4